MLPVDEHLTVAGTVCADGYLPHAFKANMCRNCGLAHMDRTVGDRSTTASPVHADSPEPVRMVSPAAVAPLPVRGQEPRESRAADRAESPVAPPAMPPPVPAAVAAAAVPISPPPPPPAAKASPPTPVAATAVASATPSLPLPQPQPVAAIATAAAPNRTATTVPTAGPVAAPPATQDPVAEESEPVQAGGKVV
jgi:hypothetical protein